MNKKIIAIVSGIVVGVLILTSASVFAFYTLTNNSQNALVTAMSKLQNYSVVEFDGSIDAKISNSPTALSVTFDGYSNVEKQIVDLNVRPSGMLSLVVTEPLTIKSDGQMLYMNSSIFKSIAAISGDDAGSSFTAEYVAVPIPQTSTTDTMFSTTDAVTIQKNLITIYPELLSDVYGDYQQNGDTYTFTYTLDELFTSIEGATKTIFSDPEKFSALLAGTSFANRISELPQDKTAREEMVSTFFTDYRNAAKDYMTSTMTYTLVDGQTSSTITVNFDVIDTKGNNNIKININADYSNDVDLSREAMPTDYQQIDGNNYLPSDLI